MRRALIIALAAILVLALYYWVAMRPLRPAGDPATGLPPECAEFLGRPAAERGAAPEVPPECAALVAAEVAVPETPPAPAAHDQFGRAGPCVAKGVIEGALDVSCESWRGPVRLLGIEGPAPGQAGYRRASGVLELYVSGTAIWLDYEIPGQPAWDEYGRLLAYVYADELNINVEMVRDGWARVATGDDPGRSAEELARAEQEARAAKRGLWMVSE